MSDKDLEQKAREIVEKHSYCVDTSFGNAKALIKEITQALKIEHNDAIEAAANVCKTIFSGHSAQIIEYTIRALKKDQK